LAVDPYHLMVASHGHDPRHDLFLLGVACASTLLSYAVGVTTSFVHFTHICASRKRNARIFLKLGTVTVFDTVSSYSASSARLASRPSSASPRCLLSIRNILIKAQAHHAPHTKFKEEDDDFLDTLHSEYGVSV
jgi:fluoride ion exporter CrcB/FEX